MGYEDMLRSHEHAMVMDDDDEIGFGSPIDFYHHEEDGNIVVEDLSDSIGRMRSDWVWED